MSMNRRHMLGAAIGAALWPTSWPTIGRLAVAQTRGAAASIDPKRVANVNTTDIRAAIELGCQTMSNVFNRDDNDIPFFASQARPHPHLAFNDSFSEAHVPGRHLNALLSAEQAAGIIVDEDVIAKHERAAFFAFDGPAPLPLNRARPDGPLKRFLPHNLREGFHALYALARFRDSQPARDRMASSIQAVRRYWDPDRGWDRDQLAALGIELHEWAGPLITGIARSMGPLVKFYRATSYAPALELAITIKDKVLSECFDDHGSFDMERFGTHTHSTTCVLSSLAQLADLLHDMPLMAYVAEFFRHGLRTICNEIGWSVENTSDEAPRDLGEANNTGDILETALILGAWGHADALHWAERIVRAHLLPAQLRDVSWIDQPENARNEDGLRDVAQRHLGAWGFPAPYGHQAVGVGHVSFNMDIVGGAVGSLCEAYQAIARKTSTGLCVQLLFDHESDDVRIQSPYTHDRLAVEVRRPGPVWIRIPSWVDRQQLRVSAGTEPLQVRDDWLFGTVSQPTTITVEFPLSPSNLVLKFRDREIRARLRGDSVEAMENFGTDLNFFPPLE